MAGITLKKSALKIGGEETKDKVAAYNDYNNYNGTRFQGSSSASRADKPFISNKKKTTSNETDMQLLGQHNHHLKRMYQCQPGNTTQGELVEYQ